MKRFYCQCGQQVFFESTDCVNCGRAVGFDPEILDMVTVVPRPNGEPAPRYCRNQPDFQTCNWLTKLSSGYCLACHCNHVIPDLGKPDNLRRWQALEQAKKRLVYTLLQLGLPLESKWDDPQNGLWFDFLEHQPSPYAVEEGFVSTGHAGGVITINILEADDLQREAMRHSMNEPYRTLLGHFRHESGHYYWQILVARDNETLEAFRSRFGDERQDYTAALERYYQQGPQPFWNQRHISAYASAHPWEDWAETWSHYLHMVDTLDTATVYGLLPDDRGQDFAVRIQRWMELTLTLNALNRSMGLHDAYPFVLSSTVREKLAFIDHLLGSLRGR